MEIDRRSKEEIQPGFRHSFILLMRFMRGYGAYSYKREDDTQSNAIPQPILRCAIFSLISVRGKSPSYVPSLYQ